MKRGKREGNSRKVQRIKERLTEAIKGRKDKKYRQSNWALKQTEERSSTIYREAKIIPAFAVPESIHSRQSRGIRKPEMPTGAIDN